MSAADELVDVIDDAGNTIGVVTRHEMRQKRLLHRCTYVLVFNAHGDLFVHLRTATKDVYPSYCGGVLGAGETFEQGVRREICEELGIDANAQMLFPFRYQDAATFARGMAYRLVHEGPFHLQADEIVRGEFVPLPEVLERTKREPYCPDGVQVLEEYLRSGELGA